MQKNPLKINEESIYYRLIVNKSKRLSFLKEIKVNFRSFIFFIFTMMHSKDVILFKNFIKYILESLHFKKHKKFLYNLKVLVNLVFNLIHYRFGLLGIFIKIKGKIGVGGNLKKKKYILKKGSFSFTRKDQKITYIKDSIKTYSGVLGFEIYLSYT